MSKASIPLILETLKKPGSPYPKNEIIESLSYDEAIAILKRIFGSIISEPDSFSLTQKFLAISLDYDANLLFAEVSTGFSESIAICVDSTILFKPTIKKFIVYLYKLPAEMEQLTDYEAKRMIANSSCSGISPHELFINAGNYELVHVKDYTYN